MIKTANLYKNLITSIVTLTILLVTTQTLTGKNYYFSTSTGDDARTSTQALNPLTPWKSISKLNSFSSSLTPGDSVFFKRGDIFIGTITPLTSGKSGSSIVFCAYGTGAKPVVTGFTTITGWTNEGSGIYSKVISAQSSPNMVTVNGMNTAKGRWPNTSTANGGYLTINSHTGSTSLTSSSLNSSVTNWTGAEVVLKRNHWVIDRATIINHSGSALTFTGGSGEIANGYGFFIQNDTRTFDIVGEWAYRSGKLYMYFGANNPNDYIVKVSVVDKNIFINYKGYITLQNLSLEGANIYGIQQLGGSNFTVLDCNIDYIGTTGIYISGNNNAIVNRCRITNINDNAFFSSSTCNNTYFGYNTLRNCVLIPGATGSGDLHGFGVYLDGNNETVEYNTIDVMGYLGIHVNGNNKFIRYNVIDSVCLIKDDGGGIYVNGHYQTIMSNRIIEYNIVTNAIGNWHGTPSTVSQAYGIFADGYSNNVIIRNNTVTKCANAGIFLARYAHHISLLNNLVIDNTANLFVSEGDAIPGYLTINGNVFVTASTNDLIKTNIGVNRLASLGTWYDNYFIKPFDDKAVFKIDYSTGTKEEFDALSISGMTAYDAKPNTTPVTITPYVINSLIGTNKFTNGAFTSNITGAAFSYTGTGTLTWDNSNKISGGAAKVSYTSFSTTKGYSQVKLSVGALKTNTKYILKYDILGTKVDKMVRVFLKYGLVYYTDRFKYQPYTNSVTHVEMLLEPNSAAATAELFFEFRDVDGTVYLDNVEFYEADVSKADPTEHILFEYATSTARTIALSGTWKTLANVSVSGSITIQPYSSILLFNNTATNTNNAPNIQNQNLQLNENTPSGASVGTILATDPDADQTLSYSILSGNTDGAFAINALTGVLTVANSTALNFIVSPSFSLIVKVQDNGTGLLSSQATITVNLLTVSSGCNASGSITYQVWNNIGGSTLVNSLTSNIDYPNNPTLSTLITSMEGTINQSNEYGARIAGYICAPATGSYTFWIASDNQGELWLSNDDQPANKQRIAYVAGATSPRDWNSFTTQKSVAIYLVQGQIYYIEALMKEAYGGDCLAIGWLRPGQTGSVPSEVIPGSVLLPIGSSQTILVSSVILPATSSVDIGFNVTLLSTVSPENATNSNLNWSSSNPSIATVDNNGLVTGKQAGTVTITASSADGSNITGNCLVTVNSAVCSAIGTITYQVWNNIGGSTSITSLTSNTNYPNSPSSSTLIMSMEGTTNQANEYGSRIVGYICAPATGNYTFWIASDNQGELWLSNDDQPVNKQRIAYVAGATLPRVWNSYATQKSIAIYLVQGQSYYIEALMKEAYGGDCLAIGWLKPGQTGSIPSEVIPGSVLSPIGSVKAKEVNISIIEQTEPEVKLSVYPNPLGNNELTIKIDNLSSEATLKIFTITGVECMTEVIQNSNVIQINRSIFKRGMYIVKVFNDIFLISTKLIVN